MYNSVHRFFISTPLLAVMQDGIAASASLKMGAECYPLGEYFYQTLFLRMTGAQEQKMKCLCWEMATNDYKYRYEYLHNKNYGECSTYSDKCGIYKDIIGLVKKWDPDFKVSQIWDDVILDEAVVLAERGKWEKKVINNRKKQIAKNIEAQEKKKGISLSQDAINMIEANIMGQPLPEEDYAEHLAGVKKRKAVSELVSKTWRYIKNSNIVIWKEHDFCEFTDNWGKKIKGDQVTPKDASLLGNQMQKFYENVVYVHRNRCAHNTSSYQQNLPSLSTLASKEILDQNYFYRFALLIIIDEVFLRLYKKYVELKEKWED